MKIINASRTGTSSGSESRNSNDLNNGHGYGVVAFIGDNKSPNSAASKEAPADSDNQIMVVQMNLIPFIQTNGKQKFKK